MQALAAIPLLLIAPVMGFIARCVVDYLHAHIEEEVGKRFAEMESWQARRRPRVKRWQTILDEDRDEDKLDPSTTSAISEYQYQASCPIPNFSLLNYSLWLMSMKVSNFEKCKIFSSSHAPAVMCLIWLHAHALVFENHILPMFHRDRKHNIVYMFLR